MPDTIKSIATAEQKISRSRFICFLYPIEDIACVRGLIADHNKEYANATHNCYAYVLGPKQETQYYSDAGEPGGTAGKPMLNSLLRHNLTNVLAIVTRYYGGVKLGVKGLIEAYGSSVELALESAKVMEYKLLESIYLWTGYALLEQIKHHANTLGAEVTALDYQERILLRISIPQEACEELKSFLDACALNGGLEYVSSLPNPPKSLL